MLKVVTPIVSLDPSYVVNEADGRFGSFCVYEAPHALATFDHAREVGITGLETYSVEGLIDGRSYPSCKVMFPRLGLKLTGSEGQST